MMIPLAHTASAWAAKRERGAGVPSQTPAQTPENGWEPTEAETGKGA